ncbi:MAG TPA: DoxX family protein [Rhodopila sp.]|uniref:DoxX family protein n=1 Tax=Rhodopila sp. TaxID=2480087 RepID=UPI002B591808|nr:DoxX family protein [Rhodopila sp.]HVY15072.1 DoxX family protein [Rhodopila sp.]
MDWIALLGRLAMSFIFIHSGIGKAMAPSGTMAYFAKLGLPVPGAAYALTLAIEIGAATLFLLGFRARVTALILAAWCVATAFTAHYHPGDTNSMIHFWKNICMAGGFLQIVAYGAGRLSLDRK